MRRIALLFLALASAQADTLVLRNGTRVTGRWWAADAEIINFLVDGRRLDRYPRTDVAEVIFGDGQAANPAPASAAPVAGAPVVSAPAAASVAAAPARAAASSSAMSAPALREPDEIGVMYFQDSGGYLVPVERIAAVPHRAASGFGGRPSQYWDMPGARSTFRLRSDSRLAFVAEMPGGIGPQTWRLYPLESRGNARRTRTRNGMIMTVPLSVRRLSGETYIFAPVNVLGAGEYSFSPMNSNDGYCFGID